MSESKSADSELPPEILSAIAVSNAKSIGEQPAILANLALANQIANNNLAQQQALTANQSMLQITLATVAKAVDVISNIDPAAPSASRQIETMVSLIERMHPQAGDDGRTAAAAAVSPEGASTKKETDT